MNTRWLFGLFAVVFPLHGISPAAHAAATSAECIMIDTFSSCVESGIPCGWKANNKIEGISMRHDSGDYYISIKSKNDIESIGKEIEYSITEYPLITWRWRVHAVPAGGREDEKNKSNSAAGVYAIFKGGFPFGYTIKYVWSATLPPGTMTKSPFSGKTMIFVLRSGVADTGKWFTETRNVLEDYRKAFGSDSPPQTKGVAIMTSSDRSKSMAAADYDDIYVLKKKEPVVGLSKRQKVSK